MGNKCAIFYMLLATVVCIQSYCDYKSREMHAQISKALVQANRWLIEAQEEDGKWVDLQTTGNALAVLKMIGHDKTRDNRCSRSFEKAAQYFMLHRYEIKRASGLALPYIIMGLNALCEDPSNYYRLNLTKKLVEEVKAFPRGEFNHYFQYSLALVALGINDVPVPWHAVERLNNEIRRVLLAKETHSKDTSSLFVMALKSVAPQFKNNQGHFMEINFFINQLTSVLSKKMKVGEDNFWTKSLVLQAQSAADKSLPWEQPRCELLYKSLLETKENDASFGGLSSALHILPSLAGVSFLDLNKDGRCHKTGVKQNSGKKSNGINNTAKPWIKVCVKIEFEAVNKRNPTTQFVMVPEGSTALDALKMASKSHSCYQFEVAKTVWGNYLTQLCRLRKSVEKHTYWIFYVDDKLATIGLNHHVVKKNQCIVMKYRKLKLQ